MFLYGMRQPLSASLILEKENGAGGMNHKSLKVYLFYCASSFDAVETALRPGECGDELKAIPIPCSGKIDILYLTKAFETGADCVAVLMCREGECRYLEGNLRARKRVGA